MTQLANQFLADLAPDEQAIVDTLLADPQALTWRVECCALGRLWYQRERRMEALTRLGLELAPALGRDPAAVITELVTGFATARQDHGAHELTDRWQKRVAQLDGLHRIISAANSTVGLDTSLATVVETVANVMTSDVCSIFLFNRDRDELRLRATHGLNPGAIGEVYVRLGRGITGLAAQVGQPIAVPDVHDDRRVDTDPRLDERAYRSILCVPIILFARNTPDWASDRLQGVISVQTVAPRTWSQEEIDFLEVVAGELAFFIANAQRYQETDERLHQKIRELTTFQRVSAAIATTLDLQTVLNLIVEQAVVLSSVDRADIFHSDEAHEHLELIASYGGHWDERLSRVIVQALTEGHPLAVVNAYDDERFPELAAVAHGEGYHSLFCIPLRVGPRIIGVIALYARRQRDFNYEEVQLLSTFADEAAIAIENARLYREAKRSLQVKSVLLQEMHHRVRNNLQTIGALLQMQLRRVPPDSPGAQALAQSEGRIQAIAAVHNLLCRNDIGITTIQEIARQIVDAAHTGLVAVPVQFAVLGDAVPISSREATVVALVINELVANALSHGVGAEGGRIEVVGWLATGQAHIEVRDDGPAHPITSTKSSSGMGQSIIGTLVEADLQGNFQFTRDDHWARAHVTFPYTRPTLYMTDEQGAGI